MKSIWATLVNCSSCNGCDIECATLTTPKYDVERFGITMKNSPKHADLLLVTGPTNEKTKDVLERVYNQMPEGKKVVAVGNCAISGCVFKESYNVKQQVDEIVPVDMYVSGCPPRPEAIMHGLLKLLGETNSSKGNKT